MKRVNGIFRRTKHVALICLMSAAIDNTATAQKIIGGVYQSFFICADSSLWA